MGGRASGWATFAPALSAAVILAATIVLVEISFAALVFSGPLEPFVGAGIGYFLFGTLAICLMVALTSAFPTGVALAQDTPAVVFAAMGASVATALAGTAGAGSLVSTVVATIAVTSLVTGALFLLLGTLKLGNLVRYVPYPVIGGFLAGTGWLLVDGAVNVMAGSRITPGTLSTLFAPQVLRLWLPGLALGVLTLLTLRRRNHPLILPGLLLAAAAVFHLTLLGSGTSVAAARADGWLLGPFTAEALWQPLTPAALQQVRWDVVVAQSGSMATVFLIGLLSFLLNATGIELATQRDVELNRELKVTGLANALSGLGGGPVGYHALSLSVLSHKMTPNGRVTGVAVSALCGLALAGGAGVLSLLPTFLLGGMLLFLGLDFLVTWLYDSRARLSSGEYAIVVAIAVAMATIGVLEGVAVGIALATILFVVEYSRGSPIRRELSGDTYQSNVDRAPAERALLRRRGRQVYIMELQRFIFFGTANKLLEAVRQRVSSADHPPRFVILDFHRVNGLDASAMSSFEKMQQLARGRGFVLILTALGPRMARQLGLSQPADGDAQHWRVFADLDHGVEWCEEQLLADERLRDGETADASTDSPGELDALIERMTRQHLPAGSRLIRQGDHPRGLYYLEAGRLTAQVDADGRAVRLRTMHPGVFVGELSLYAGATASASVVADEPSSVLFLAADELTRLEREEPAVAAVLHRHIAETTSERLLHATRVMSALM